MQRTTEISSLYKTQYQQQARSQYHQNQKKDNAGIQKKKVSLAEPAQKLTLEKSKFYQGFSISKYKQEPKVIEKKLENNYLPNTQDIPDGKLSIFCPISQEDTKDWLKVPCGHAFNRQSLEKMFKKGLNEIKPCPCCKEKFTMGSIFNKILNKEEIKKLDTLSKKQQEVLYLCGRDLPEIYYQKTVQHLNKRFVSENSVEETIQKIIKAFSSKDIIPFIQKQNEDDKKIYIQLMSDKLLEKYFEEDLLPNIAKSNSKAIQETVFVRLNQDFSNKYDPNVINYFAKIITLKLDHSLKRFANPENFSLFRTNLKRTIANLFAQTTN